MSLTLYGFHDRPHDIAATKIGTALEDCPFLLDFSRPLERSRWLGFKNPWVGLTLGWLVPVVHQGEEKGSFVVGIERDQPYFADIPKLWKEHCGKSRTIKMESVDALRVVADFGTHFPQDCQ